MAGSGASDWRCGPNSCPRLQVERKRFLSQRSGAEREALTRQQVGLEEGTVHERTRQAARSADLRNAQQALRNKREFVRQYDARLNALRHEHQEVRSHACKLGGSIARGGVGAGGVWTAIRARPP